MAEIKENVKDEQVQTPAAKARESLSREGNTQREAPKTSEPKKDDLKTGDLKLVDGISRTTTTSSFLPSQREQFNTADKHLPKIEITNDAAHLKSSLDERDPQKREAELRLLYRTLNADHLAKAETGIAKPGVSVDETLHSRLSDRTVEAIDTYRKAAQENRPVSAQERVHLAQLGAGAGDRDLIIEAVAGSSPQARAARESLKDDRAFNAALLRNFKERTPSSALSQEQLADPASRVDPALRDYIKEGRVRLATITEANTGYIFSNKENTDLAVQHALPEERATFKQGYELKHSANDSLTEEQKQSLKFYEQLQDKFEKGGNKGDALRWQDNLLNGRETIVSQIASTEKDGVIWSSHSRGDALSAATKLNEQDWRLLHNADHGINEEDKKAGQAFKKQFEQAVDKFAQSPDEAQRIKSLVYEKSAKNSYSEAQKVATPLDISLKDAQHGSQPEQLRDTFKAITSITADQAKQYKEDPAVRKQVADQLDQGPAEARPIAERLLKKVETEGRPPEPSGFDKIQISSLTGRQLTLTETQDLLKDHELASRLNRPDSQLTQEERQANRTLNSAIIRGLDSRKLNERPLLLGEGLPGDHNLKQAEANTIRRQLGENGGNLSLEQQYRLNVPINDIYKNVASSSEAQQNEFINKLTTSPDIQTIARAVAKQGEVRLEDLARSYSVEGKDARALSTALSNASPEDISKAKAEWSLKYPGDLTSSVLKKASDADAPELRAVLQPSADGREQLYENYRKYLDNRGGLGLDGSGLTLERASHLHQEAQKSYEQSRQNLPAEQQKQLDEFFGKALQQHKDSEIKQTQILLDAAITAATLGAGAPTTVAGVAARIAAGGITEATGTALARGEFKAENFIADFVQGGTSAYAGRAAVKAGEQIAAKLEHGAADLSADLSKGAGEKTVRSSERTSVRVAEMEEAHTVNRGESKVREIVKAGEAAESAIKHQIPIQVKGASAEFTNEITTALKAIPSDTAKRLKENGVSIEVVGNIYQHRTDPAWLDGPIRGQPGRTRRQSEAFFDFEKKKIVIVENSPEGKHLWPEGEVRRAVAHEVGHPVDTHTVKDLLKLPEFARSAQPGRPGIGNSISDLPEFQKAFFADMQHFSDSISNMSASQRKVAENLIGYHLADRGLIVDQLNLKGIGTHADNLAHHDANRIREIGGRHSAGRSEAFADVYSDLLIGDNLFTKHLPNTTRIVRDHVLNLPTVPFNEASVERMQALGFKLDREQNGHLIFKGDNAVAVTYNGRLSEIKIGDTYRLARYNSEGQLSTIYEKTTPVNGIKEEYSYAGIDRQPHPPVIGRLGNGKLQFFDQ